MGVACKAEDTKLDRPLALKFLPAHLLGNEEARKRFEHEAKSAAALHHANICPVDEVDDAGASRSSGWPLPAAELMPPAAVTGGMKEPDTRYLYRTLAPFSRRVSPPRTGSTTPYCHQFGARVRSSNRQASSHPGRCS